MARFTIVTTRASGLYSCEFDVQPDDGAVMPLEIFQCVDRGALTEYVVLAVLPHRGKPTVTLVCLNFAIPDNQLTGTVCETRPMKNAEKRRYEKHLRPPNQPLQRT
jgi:hypothetical protein